MNYWRRNVRDIRGKTITLSMAQMGAYGRLLDELYSTEKPLPADASALYRICGAMTKAERKEVEAVAARFFPIGPDGMRSGDLEEVLSFKEALARRLSAFWNSIPRYRRTELASARRAAKLRATPPWLTAEDKAAISAIYERAAQLTEETGVAHEVDHTVPLQGKTVSGLHVPWNLNPMPAAANRRKGRSHNA